MEIILFFCFGLAVGVHGQSGFMGMMNSLFGGPSSGLSGREPAVITNKDSTDIGEVNFPQGGDKVTRYDDDNHIYMWGSWGKYGSCSATCGKGVIASQRICFYYKRIPNQKQGLGGNPMAPLFMSSFSSGGLSAFLAYTMMVGNGPRHRSVDRNVNTYYTGDRGCSGNNLRTLECKVMDCPIKQCLTDWSPFSDCSASCGSAVKSRIRTCTCRNESGKPDCGATLKETLQCVGLQECKIISQYTAWTPWDSCKRRMNAPSCAQRRMRTCLGPSGTCIGPPSQERICFTGPCSPTTTPQTTTTTRAANQDRCDARNAEGRVDCGWPGISREKCIARGCCYSDKIYEVNWCFYDNVRIPVNSKQDSEVSARELNLKPRPTKVTG